MHASLPPELIEVFERSVIADYVTIDAHGQPIGRPATPFYRVDEGCIDLTAPLGEPDMADAAALDPHVALLFAHAPRRELARWPMVLVQGTAIVDDGNLEANRERFARDSTSKSRRPRELPIPDSVRRLLSWYFSPIYLHVRPERIYVWPAADVAAEPSLYDAHMEEVRSGHSEEPEVGHAAPRGGTKVWDACLDPLEHTTQGATLSIVGPDGFPFAVRVPVRSDRTAGLVRIATDPVGAPLEPGLACLSLQVNGGASGLRPSRGLQVCGDLIRDAQGWSVAPHRVSGAGQRVGRSSLDRGRDELLAALRFRRTAKAEQRRRSVR